MTLKLHGLVAATHTPFDTDGRLDLSGVDRQAEYMAGAGVVAVFIGGTTGESHSLTVAERLMLAERWASVTKGSPLKVVVHVGANCLEDSRALAEQAQGLGVAAIAALSPSYFKPQNLDALVECGRVVAAKAPGLPFYFYDIPSMTGVSLSMPDYLDLASTRIPTLAGIKFTNLDLMAYQRCLASHGGRFDIPWGTDEALLAALAVGGLGAVGSSYNFAAPLYVRLIEAFRKGDLEAARQEQSRSVALIQLLAGFGYMAAARATMGMLGVPIGPPRLPFTGLAPDRHEELREALGRIGFFEWAAPGRGTSGTG